MPEWEDELEQLVTEETEEVAKQPPLYKVLLHNDDFTTMDFVIFILRTVFLHTPEDAERIMWNVHRQGVGVAGVYTYEVAESKVTKVETLAEQYEFPLMCSIEED